MSISDFFLIAILIAWYHAANWIAKVLAYIIIAQGVKKYAEKAKKVGL